MDEYFLREPVDSNLPVIDLNFHLRVRKGSHSLPAGESTVGATITLINDAHLEVEINGKSLYTETVMHLKLAELRSAFPAMDPAHQGEPFPKLQITGIWSNPSMEWPYVLAVDDELVRARPVP